MEFNKEQQEVIDCKSDRILVMAGAGSGKTATMLGRISKQIKDGADPASFLVLTFTRAAALNMRQRYLKDHKEQSVPNFSTFHAFCYQLLYTDYSVLRALGYTKVPTICDTNTERKIRQMSKMKASVKLTDKKLETGEFVSPLERYEYERYQKTLKKQMISENTITFKQLMEEVVNLFLKDDACIEKYKKKYHYIYIDEFQDTDPLQWKFANTFSDTAQITVVGDTLQNIYSFRGCSNAIIKSLSTDRKWNQLRLHENYRSTVEIVEYANDLAESYADSSYRVTMSAHHLGCPVCVTPLDERKFLSESIQQKERIAITDVAPCLEGTTAILARTNKEVSVIKSILDSSNISYTESNKASDIPGILRSVVNNDYLVEWTSSFMKIEDYANYIRWRTIWYQDKSEYPSIQDYVDKYDKVPKIHYYLSAIFGIRKVLMDNTIDVFTKILAIYKYLGMNENDCFEASENFNNGEILTYVLRRFNESKESNIYVGTVHSVKGLEYDNVMLLGVNDKCWKLDNEDNLNLYYVGITRAKKKLFIFKYEEEQEDKDEEYNEINRRFS